MVSRQMELMFMFERVGESLLTIRNNGKIKYNVPKEFYSNDFNDASKNVIQDRFSSQGVDERGFEVTVQPLRTLPNLTEVLKLDKTQNFCVFAPAHKKAASELINIFMNAPDYETFKSLLVYCHEQVNTELWTYCSAVAITNRPDLKGIQVPSLAEILPNKCVPAMTIREARKVATMVGDRNEEPIIIPATFTADETNPEQRLAYFREDIGINLHHWHWHLVYPDVGPREVVDKNRRGELFYYMHQQIIGRYNTERLCNDLNYVKPMDSFREPIPEGYYSKMDNFNSGRAWQGRPENMPLRAVRRDDYGVSFTVETLEHWANQITSAIASGRVVNTNNETVLLDEERGIDILANIVECSLVLTVNRPLYGDLHNAMHMIVGFCHDPERVHLEDVSAIGDLATTMRDPVFYRVHSRINNIWKSHKDILPQYGPDRLAFNGISISNSELQSRDNAEKNVLVTYWETSNIELNRGLDFSDRGNTFAQVQYLQHSQFTYNITVRNETQGPLEGTIRIFIGTSRDQNKREIRFEEQRGLMLELDKFSQTLQPGDNVIRRTSEESSITIPYEQTFRRLMDNIANNTLDENYCGCGWPQHMLIPKGRPEGMPFDLFVMVSDGRVDQVRQQSPPNSALCKNALSFCGARGQNYPDLRSMGYPFDRAVSNTPTLNDFTRNYSNMSVHRVVIRHLPDVIRKRAE